MPIKLMMPGNIPNWHGAASMCASKLSLQDTQIASASSLSARSCLEVAGWHMGWSHKVTEQPAVSQCWASVYFTGLEEM